MLLRLKMEGGLRGLELRDLLQEHLCGWTLIKEADVRVGWVSRWRDVQQGPTISRSQIDDGVWLARPSWTSG